MKRLIAFALLLNAGLLAVIAWQLVIDNHNADRLGIPAKPAVEKPTVAPEKPQAEKPAAKPEASVALAANKEPAAVPKKPKVEKSAEKLGPGYDSVAKSLAIAALKSAKESAPKPKIVRAGDLPVVEITVKQLTYIEYGTDMGGDEQEARIKIQAKYANNSHIRRDKTTNLEAVYRYRSKPSYLGEDSVELEYSDHQIGSGPDDPGTTTITRQVINITVEK